GPQGNVKPAPIMRDAKKPRPGTPSACACFRVSADYFFFGRLMSRLEGSETDVEYLSKQG
ncbi:hypothetical protein MYX64_13590, partial [Nitrospinae bacterium AH_259_B05_G02_I21]|nr:hypothetical protein [Nitrospinae bacterium AH_259_B05_G02_I21]